VESRSPAGESDCDDGGVNPGTPIRLAVIDDHPAIALAIEAAVRVDAGAPPIELIGAARTLEAGLVLVRQLGASAAAGPAVALCDVQVEAGIDGLGVVAAARAAGCRALVLTSFDRASLMRAAFERGAAGFLDKAADVDEILRAVRVVAAGGTAFSAQALDAARSMPRAPSDREVSVLRSLAGGASSDEIGARLGISTRTVESHLRRMFDRYGVVSRTELAVLALREGWVEVGGS
jgi:two-component system response regulator DesR